LPWLSMDSTTPSGRWRGRPPWPSRSSRSHTQTTGTPPWTPGLGSEPRGPGQRPGGGTRGHQGRPATAQAIGGQPDGGGGAHEERLGGNQAGLTPGSDAAVHHPRCEGAAGLGFGVVGVAGHEHAEEVGAVQQRFRAPCRQL
jgi:hypothetical protein